MFLNSVCFILSQSDKIDFVAGISGGLIAGISVAAVIGAISLGVCVYFVFYRRKKAKEESFLENVQSIENAHGDLLRFDLSYSNDVTYFLNAYGHLAK